MSTKLFLQERREQIIALLGRDSRVSVADLSQRFRLSQATIRSDLDALAAQGMLVRTHGGAIAADRTDSELSFAVRRRLYSVQKGRIGAAAAALVEDGEAIALDASTTALALADHIKGRHELTVITNGLMVSMALLGSPGITVLMPGGFLRRDSVSLVGHKGNEFIEQFNFQKGFFGAKGLTLEEGLSDVNSDEVIVKRELVAHARRIIAIVDSSKWGRVGFVSFASMEQVDCVITDEGAPPDMVAGLRESGVQVVIA
ncbi:MAG: DeoR/GlpR transcriptional regulator [Anaerolineales bacterium]|nr:MAG: DeoR/GlpR transcriptional regulator [Anaerolineales bacterium]